MTTPTQKADLVLHEDGDYLVILANDANHGVAVQVAQRRTQRQQQPGLPQAAPVIHVLWQQLVPVATKHDGKEVLQDAAAFSRQCDEQIAAAKQFLAMRKRGADMVAGVVARYSGQGKPLTTE